MFRRQAPDFVGLRHRSRGARLTVVQPINHIRVSAFHPKQTFAAQPAVLEWSSAFGAAEA